MRVDSPLDIEFHLLKLENRIRAMEKDNIAMLVRMKQLEHKMEDLENNLSFELDNLYSKFLKLS